VKAKHLIWLRRCSQAFFLCLFLYLLIESRLPQDVYINYTSFLSQNSDIRLEQPVNFFWRLDPLAWLSSTVSSYQWIKGFGWAIGLVFATALMGRFFCGFICPFGAIHHFASFVKPALKGKALIDANQTKPDRKIKYFLLIAILCSAIVGLNISGWFDPISWLFRSMALAVFPAVGNALIALSNMCAQSDFKVINYVGYAIDFSSSKIFGFNYLAFQTGFLIGTVFLVLIFLNRIRPRFFCRVFCPLGALLGLCSRYSIIRLDKKEEKCTHCGICSRHCQGAASCEPGKDWQSSECVMCLNCHCLCPQDALSFKLNRPKAVNSNIDLKRRIILGGIVTGATLPLLSRLDGQLYKTAPPQLIRPPGAVAEADFLSRCLRCGLCMKVCPTNGINPAFAEAGLSGFWTPNLLMNYGYCEYTCTLCGSVCPTGAIRKITFKEKSQQPIRIGSAYVDRGRCLPWSGNAPCIVCEEHCPTSPKAIALKNDVIIKSDGRELKVQLPYVDLERCVGCGICQYKCPIKGRPAIVVISAGESRSAENQILL